MRIRILLTLAFLLVGSPFVQAAETPDIIRFKDGGFVRGTITELDPEGEVVIQTLDGRTLTYDVSAVVYAGPVASQKIEGAGPTFDVKLQPADFQNLQFYRFIGPYDFKSLCKRPCTLEVAAGPLRLGAGIGAQRPVEGNLITVEGDGRIEVEYKKRSGQRIAGAAVGLTGGATAVGLFMASFFGAEQRVTVSGTGIESSLGQPDNGFLFAALATGAVTAGAALFLLLRKDVVKSTFVPAQ